MQAMKEKLYESLGLDPSRQAELMNDLVHTPERDERKLREGPEEFSPAELGVLGAFASAAHRTNNQSADVRIKSMSGEVRKAIEALQAKKLVMRVAGDLVIPTIEGEMTAKQLPWSRLRGKMKKIDWELPS